MITQHRDHIMGSHLKFDEVSMFLQSIKGMFSVEILFDADMLYYDFRKTEPKEVQQIVFDSI